MSDKGTQDAVIQSVYGALLGGMIASFAAAAVFMFIVDNQINDRAPFLATLTGLAIAIALLTAGLMLADRAAWLGTSLLFGSGFTTLWTVAVSFTVQKKWMVLVALGVAIVVAGLLGRRRFGAGGMRKGADTPGGITLPDAAGGETRAPQPSQVPSPEVAPPSQTPEIALPPGVHPVDGGDIRD